MAFVAEKISKQDRNDYGIGISLLTWVIDRENDIFMIYTGASGRGSICHYEIHDKNNIIFIDAEKCEEQYIIEKQTRWDISFNLTKIKIPKNIEKNISEIKKTVELAFKEYGVHGIKERTGKVTINFPNEDRIYFVGKELSKKGE